MMGSVPSPGHRSVRRTTAAEADAPSRLELLSPLRPRPPPRAKAKEHQNPKEPSSEGATETTPPLARTLSANRRKTHAPPWSHDKEQRRRRDEAARIIQRAWRRFVGGRGRRTSVLVPALTEGRGQAVLQESLESVE